MVAPGVRVEGVRELTRALNRAGHSELTKRMGQKNKAIGDLVIDRLQPLPASVGLGAGATVRSSASARLVQLRTGGKHREAPSPRLTALQQWGRRHRPRRSDRPYIARTAINALPNINELYMQGVDEAIADAGLEA